MVFTDGTALGGTGTMLQEDAVQNSALLSRFAIAAPLAFSAPSDEVINCLQQVGKNFVSSTLPLDAPVPPKAGAQGSLPGKGGVRMIIPAVSAGHDSHPSTTHSATAAAWSFLERKVAERTVYCG